MPQFIFFGTDKFSIQVLETLRTGGLKPTALIAPPDRPQGRHLKLTPPPIIAWAQQHQIPYYQPASLKKLEPEIDTVLQNPELDFFLVASYGKIIPATILDYPKNGVLNIHPSLLPKYRGATPIESAILAGERETGVSIIKLDTDMDHGPLLAQELYPLPAEINYLELRDELAKIGAKLILSLLPSYLAGTLAPQEQDHSKATFTQKIVKADGQIDLTAAPEKNDRKIRAFISWPGTFFQFNHAGQIIRVLIKKARLVDGQLVIERVIPAGKKEMSWDSFCRGYNFSLPT